MLALPRRAGAISPAKTDIQENGFRSTDASQR
jgi:hypothetical protein